MSKSIGDRTDKQETERQVLHAVPTQEPQKSYSSWDTEQPPKFMYWSIAAVILGILCLCVPTTTPESRGISQYLVLGLLLLLIGFAGACARSNYAWWKRRPKPKPEVKSGSEKYDNAKTYWSGKARSSQRLRTGLAVFVSFLSTAAVLCLSVQIIAVRHGIWASILITSEFSLIALALGTIYLRSPFRKFHEDWVPARLRVQLLRREWWLYKTRIGYYLKCGDSDADALIAFEARIDEINDHKEVFKLLEMGHANSNWIVDFEEATSSAKPANMADVQVYLDNRLRQQKSDYYSLSVKKHERLDETYENIARLSLVLALILAGFHLLKLMGDPQSETNLGKLVDVSALVMPTIGAACITLRSLFESHRLSHSYEDLIHQLDNLEHQFTNLIERWSRLGSKSTNANHPKLSHQFRRLVLLTELEFTAETRRWWLIVTPERPEGG